MCNFLYTQIFSNFFFGSRVVVIVVVWFIVLSYSSFSLLFIALGTPSILISHSEMYCRNGCRLWIIYYLWIDFVFVVEIFLTYLLLGCIFVCLCQFLYYTIPFARLFFFFYRSWTALRGGWGIFACYILDYFGAIS